MFLIFLLIRTTFIVVSTVNDVVCVAVVSAGYGCGEYDGCCLVVWSDDNGDVVIPNLFNAIIVTTYVCL